MKLVSNDGEEIQYVHADHLGAPQKMMNKRPGRYPQSNPIGLAGVIYEYISGNPVNYADPTEFTSNVLV